jgi:hypothetical protein
VTGTSGSAGDEASALPPHLTVCYSTGEQPAAPVIAELGKAIPACEVTIDRVSLVVQNGPEHSGTGGSPGPHPSADTGVPKHGRLDERPGRTGCGSMSTDRP